jgi:hypothetical protein
MRPPTTPRLSIPQPPNAWRGPGAQVHRPPLAKSPIVRKPCGLCNRVRRWVGLEPRR